MMCGCTRRQCTSTSRRSWAVTPSRSRALFSSDLRTARWRVARSRTRYTVPACTLNVAPRAGVPSLRTTVREDARRRRVRCPYTHTHRICPCLSSCCLSRSHLHRIAGMRAWKEGFLGSVERRNGSPAWCRGPPWQRSLCVVVCVCACPREESEQQFVHGV